MEFKSGYNFMYQKLKAIYASKKGRPNAADEPVDLGLSEEDLKKLKLVYETKDSLMVSFKNIPTKDDKAFELTIDGEPVIGPSVGPGPKPISLYTVKPGDKFINMHFNTTVDPSIDDFYITDEEEFIYGIGCTWDYTRGSYSTSDGLMAMCIRAGTYIEDLDITVDKDLMMVALPEGGLPVYINEAMIDFYDYLGQIIPGYRIPPYMKKGKVTPGWQGATFNEAMQTLVNVIGDDEDYRSAKEHCEQYLIEGGVSVANTIVLDENNVYDYPWNGKLAGFTDEDYYQAPPIDYKQVNVGDTISNYCLKSSDNVVSYLSTLSYSQNYPASSNNSYIITGQTAGCAPVATVADGGTISAPGYQVPYRTENNGNALLLATKSSVIGSLMLFIYPLLGGRRVFFDPTATPTFTSSQLNWTTYGSETDEYANMDGDSSFSFTILKLTEEKCKVFGKSFVGFRHNVGTQESPVYEYKLYLSDYKNGHDDQGNISGTLLYDTDHWATTFADFGKDHYAMFSNYDDRGGLADSISLAQYNGTNYYTLYQGRPISADDVRITALYHSTGEELMFCIGMADVDGSSPKLLLGLYNESGWIKGYATVSINASATSIEDVFKFESYTPFDPTKEAIPCNVTIETLSGLPVYTDKNN